MRVLLLPVLCCWSLSALAQTTVESFAPVGVVKKIRQVTARFSAPMVAFGDPRAPAPFAVDCAEKGSGRWIDATTWSYDFERDLPGAVACRFTLPAERRDLDGQPLAGQREFNFSTGGPAVVQSLPRAEGERIDERQVFVLGLDAPAREESITKNAWCSADGISEKIGVRLLAGGEREAVLASRRQFVDRFLTLYFKSRGVDWSAKLPLRARMDVQLPLVVLQCQRTLPADAAVKLVWGAGIAAANGIATTQDQALAYKTRPDFTARMSCERMTAKSGCIPFLPVRLTFSAPISTSEAAQVYFAAPGGKRYPVKLDDDDAKAPFVGNLIIPGPFPEKAQLALHLPPGLKDDAGRLLENRARFPLPVRTGEQPPLVKFAAPFGIIEARGDRMLPVTVRNVEPALAAYMRSTGAALRLGADQDAEVLRWFTKLTGSRSDWTTSQLAGRELERPVLAGARDAGVRRFELPKPNGRRAFEVIGIPLREPGFHVVELASPRLGAALNKKGRVAYVHAGALVTNMVAHFKHGAQSSLVWVTSLDKGKPVAGAKVAVRDCAGKLLWSGATGKSGVARIGGELAASRCRGNTDYFISARSGADYTFTLSNWNEGIEAWRFDLPHASRGEDSRIAATVFDRTLLRAGETLHMKHFLRRHTVSGLALVRAADAPPKESGELEKEALPRKLFLIHQGSGDKTELPLQWDAAGSAQGEWKIPAEARLGVYEVMMGGQVSGQFRVEQFRVPTMKAILGGPQQPSVAPAALVLDAQVSYLSGGPAALAPVKLRTMLQDRQVAFPDYQGFSFSTGDVKEGVTQGEGGFDDDWYEGEEGAEDEAEAGAADAAVRTQALALDRSGGARIVVDRMPPLAAPQNLLAELSYQDANGETLSVSTRVPLWPSQYVIGIKPDGWLMSKEALKFQVVVLDVAGKPVANAPVEVDFFRRATYSHRRRLVGGFYGYEHSSEVKRLGPACAGQTDARGLLVCQVSAPADGNLILRAKTADTAQRPAITSREVWVAGSADWWFKASDNDRIDLLPSKPRFEPGENASFQVRSPFRRATALVTVEREGILDTYVRPLSGSEPVFTIPIKKSYAPNVFVSALVVRGRVAGVRPTALVDLGKPAYKLGMVPVRVGWAGHELKVQVAADKPVYKVRQEASVRIKVARADGKPLPAGAEVALAAVDAGLLELMPNASWDLLEAMMRERSLQVDTATAQMQVVGKRHFGRKARAPGGGGGRGASRELFETLLLWKPKVALDANGEATLQVPLNDSLSSFRIVAIASAGVGWFGSGHTEIRSSQDLMLVSGLPALVREGDRFRAGFTLRNTSASELKVTLGARVAADGAPARPLAPQAYTLAPGEAREAGWEYQAPGAASLAWEVEARSQDGAAADRVRITQKVAPAVPLRTLQATLLQLDRTLTIPVQRPADAVPGRGGVQTTFSPRLGGSLPGVRAWMEAYPYTCFEQITSRAVALRDPVLWKKVAASLPGHLDGDGLLKFFVTMDQGSDSLTAYVLSVADEAGYVIAPEHKERMQAGLAAFIEGRIIRPGWIASGELVVRKLAALEALSRRGHVTPAMVQSFTIEPNLWPTSAVVDWYLVLQRTDALADRDKQLAHAEQILRARLHMQGTTMGFSTERTDDWWWLMVSGDVNANRLLLAMLDNPRWQADMGKLARGTLGRQLQGRWGTTLANAWGVLALEKFSNKFEREPVTGTSSALLAGDPKPVSWSGAVPATVMQAWPAKAGSLTLRHDGTGKPWATVRSIAAIPLTAALNSGYRITRSVTPVEQKAKGVWSRGDVYRVRLDLEAQADMTWVVVNDPIPGSASILGSGLGRDSQVATIGQSRAGWVTPVFEERAFDSFRAYYSFVPKGKWSVEYTVRLNNEGRFSLPPTRVEAMYNPGMFGESPNAGLGVGP